MGLTVEVEMSMNDAELIDFFDANRPAFKTIAKRAYTYSNSCVPSGSSIPVRIDDVAIILVEALKINEMLREFLAEKRLNQKFWYARFADLILDRLWDEL